MRTTVIAALAALFTSAMAFGQASTVYLQNQESSDFHYVVDPRELDGLTPGSPQVATRVAGFFAEKGDSSALATLASGAEAKLDGLSDGPHLLVGFFSVEDQDEFPVRVITLQADSRIGERFYAVFSSPAQLTVPRGVGRLAQFARPAPQQPATAAADTRVATGSAEQPTPATSAAAASPAVPRAALQTVAAFSTGYAPESFTREKAGDFSVLPISESRAWSLTGTRLSGLGAVSDSSGLRISLSAPAGFSESVSYFFYVFPSRIAGGTNAVTLELLPRARGSLGACLLWKKGESTPTLIGTVTTTDTTVEVDMSAEEVSKLGSVGSGVSVDLTAGWYDRALGTWEEFYYTTFTSDEVPTRG